MTQNVLLLATDGSLASRRAGRIAIEHARKFDLRLHVVYVVQPPSVYEVEGALTMVDLVDPELQSRLRDNARRQAQKVLDEHVAGIEAAGGEVAGTHPIVGRPDAEIVRLAEELNAELLVVGSRGDGPLKRAALGSVAESVVRYAHCSVLVVRVEI